MTFQKIHPALVPHNHCLWSHIQTLIFIANKLRNRKSKRFECTYIVEIVAEYGSQVEELASKLVHFHARLLHSMSGFMWQRLEAQLLEKRERSRGIEKDVFQSLVEPDDARAAQNVLQDLEQADERGQKLLALVLEKRRHTLEQLALVDHGGHHFDRCVVDGQGVMVRGVGGPGYVPRRVILIFFILGTQDALLQQPNAVHSSRLLCLLIQTRIAADTTRKHSKQCLHMLYNGPV